MKGEEMLWTILNDKLDTLHAANRLPQAIRVAETALEVAKRAFKGSETSLATSFEKLGQLLEQKGDYTAAEAYLLKAHAILEKVKPPDHRAIFRSPILRKQKTTWQWSIIRAVITQKPQSFIKRR